MSLRFTNLRKPDTADALTPIQRAQLERAGQLWDSQSLTAEQRLADDDGGETSFRGFCEVWDVIDEDGTRRYDAWFYMVDSGTIFQTDTLEVVAEIIQFGLECDDRSLRPQLAEAISAQRKESRGTGLGAVDP